jgi:hypothetical protein
LSVTITGLIVGIIAWILKGADIPVAEGSLETTIQVLVALVGAAGIWYGRWRQGDINVLGKRK